MDRIAVVILNYNNISETLNCIEEFKKQNKIIEIVVVDNDSPDGSHDVLCKRNDIHYIQTNRNLGYAQGNNIGIKYCIDKLQSELIVISNNDIYFPNNQVIKEIIYNTRLLPKDWGYLGTVIKNESGKTYQEAPNEHTTLRERIVNSTLVGLPFRNKSNKVLKNTLGDIYESNIVSGAFFVLNAKVVEQIGAFDPYTFLYGEERILAKKYYNQGFKGYITPKVSVIHKNSATTKKYPIISYVHSLRSKYYYFKKYDRLSKSKLLLLR
ncbi:glycosyltransferase family 2 protein, partial [Priestia filamentosa]|uniref:glycosyltransferase family 2 protein n=1 Tax=Priestia filamentosa TaxID=1402861 RepID=UPI0039831D4B